MIKKILNYYKNPENIKKILPFLQFRETAFLYQGTKTTKYPAIRYMRIVNEADFLYRISHIMEKTKTIYNIYYSLAHYQGGMPVLTKPGMTGEEMQIKRESWNKYHYQQIKGYDWFIDIDSPSYKSINIAIGDTKKIYDVLVSQGFFPQIRFTGRGFHLIVFSYQFKEIARIYGFNPFEPKNIYTFLTEKTKVFHSTISEFVDYTLCDSRRIIKCPNTLVINPAKTKKIYICSVLKYDDLTNFVLKKYEFKI